MVGLLACLAVWAAPAPADVLLAQRADASPRYAAADTLRYSTPAGAPFIVALPAREGGAEVTYRPLRLPALSWLVDRSFYWNVQPGESGTLPVVFERIVAGRERDTLVLLVELTR